MRIVCVSDTHMRHKTLRVPEGDVLVHAGDFCGHGTLLEVTAVCRWLAEQPHRHKVVVAGNHDTPFEQANHLARLECLGYDLHYLEDSGVTLDGVRFWGSPWQPTFMDWAFNLSEPQLADKWALIPDDTQVLITHGPPHGILDVCPDLASRLHSAGSTTLRDVVRGRLRRLQAHIFGHIHEGAGQMQLPDQPTVFVNAATCDGQYRAVNPPIVVNL